jgi:hypothetical protein
VHLALGMSSLNEEQRTSLLQFFHSTKGRTLERCLHRSMQCDARAVRAHSIQNSRILDLVSDDGHVMAIRPFVGEAPPRLRFEKVGRNRASTFAGLCAEHDREVFADIDRNRIDVSNNRQLYLLCYRAVLRELHATMDAAIKAQGGYLKLAEVGLASRDEPSAPGMEAVRRMLISWLTFRYRFDLDAIHDANRLADLYHVVRYIDVEAPTIAASVAFSLDLTNMTEDLRGICINVLPLDEKRTTVVVSYLKRDRTEVETALCQLLAATGSTFAYLLSKTLLNYAENFVVSPRHYGTWSLAKREAIEQYVMRTLFVSDLGYESELLYLF